MVPSKVKDSSNTHSFNQYLWSIYSAPGTVWAVKTWLQTGIFSLFPNATHSPVRKQTGHCSSMMSFRMADTEGLYGVEEKAPNGR